MKRPQILRQKPRTIVSFSASPTFTLYTIASTRQTKSTAKHLLFLQKECPSFAQLCALCVLFLLPLLHCAPCRHPPRQWRTQSAKRYLLPTYLSNLCKRKSIVEYMLIHSIMQITASLNPSTLVIRNDSHLHAHHAAMAGSTSRETHFQYVPCTQHPNCIYTTHNYTLHLRCCAVPLEWC